MRLPRPYIPLCIRLMVASRQLRERGQSPVAVAILCMRQPQIVKLRRLLAALFGIEDVQLDHTPALQNRRKLYHNGVHIGYSPPANDPEHLVYRLKDDHRIKTLVRGDGAQYSDAALARKNKRIAKRRDPKRRKYRWPKRRIR